MYPQKILLLLVFIWVGNLMLSAQENIDLLYPNQKNAPGFSIAVFKGDRIILEKQYGLANLDYNIAISKETVFDIGSIAKQFTAAAILLLEQEGKLSTTDYAYTYLTQLPRYPQGNPTIAQLLNQTSGIKEVDPYLEVLDIHWRDYIRNSMLRHIIYNIKELHFAPGKHFYYTNTNYILLAAIIEKVSGQSYDAFLKQAIFEPLGMTHTLINTDAYATIPNRAIGYQEEQGVYYKTHMHGLLYSGDGQIITNAKDIFKWHQNLKHAKIGSPELWKKMHTKAKLNDGTTINSGLGVEFETYKGHQAMGFDGMITSGFVSKYLYFPSLDLGFFSTQNTFEEDFEERFFKLVDLFVTKNNGKENPKLQQAKNISKAALKKYEGTYLFYDNDNYRKANNIKLHKGTLKVLTLDGDLISTLTPIGNDQFWFGPPGNALIRFSFKGNKKQYTYDNLEHEKPWIFNEYKPYTHSTNALKEFEGQYFNKTFQLSKKIQLQDNKLYFYYRNGAWKEEISTLSKDIFEIPISPFQFNRDPHGKVISFELMGLVFERL